MNSFTTPSIGTQGVPGSRKTGIGYIIVPNDVEREKYIINCFKTGTVALGTETGEFIKRALISPENQKLIDFPSGDEQRGSPVLWQNIPLHNTIAILAVFAKGDQLSEVVEEKQFRLIKKHNGNVVDIDGKAKKATLDITVYSSEDNRGEINISIINPNKTGKLNVRVSGDVNVRASNDITLSADKHINFNILDVDGNVKAFIKYANEEGLEITDEFKNIISTNKDRVLVAHKDGKSVHIDDKIYIGERGKATHQALLGDEDNKWKESLVKEICKLTVPTGLGPSGVPINTPALQSLILPKTLTDLLSKIVHIQ